MLTCRKWGSKVGSRNAQVLETTTTTSPVTTIAGTFINLNIDVDLFSTLKSEIFKLVYG